MKTPGPMDNEDLDRMLSVGMGRAVLHLLKQDLSQYRDLILKHCLHNHAYDRQVDGTRADYLYPLLVASGQEEWYRREMLRQLAEEKDYEDVQQLLDFAVIFARAGDEVARNAIYATFRRSDTASELLADGQIVELDGIPGLLFVLDYIGGDPKLMTWYDWDTIVRQTEERSSIEEVRLALKKAQAENPPVAAALANMGYSPEGTADDIAHRRQKRIDEHFPDAEWLSENTTWEEVKNHPNGQRMLWRWSRMASDEEFANAARDIKADLPPETLNEYLLMFDKRQFPLEPERLIELVDHPDFVVGLRAVTALEIVPSPAVRDLFLRLKDDPAWSDRAIGLIRSNYQGGDNELITDMLHKESDPDHLHLMCINVMEVYEDNPVPEGLNPLLLVYERTPCSMCRWTCVETIRSTYTVPDWMIEECLYDAAAGLRELAAQLKAGTAVAD
jgi:hypothetical protein